MTKQNTHNVVRLAETTNTNLQRTIRANVDENDGTAKSKRQRPQFDEERDPHGARATSKKPKSKQTHACESSARTSDQERRARTTAGIT